MDDSAKVRYNMILGRDISTAIILNIKFSEYFIKADDGPLKGSLAPTIDFGTYEFKYLNIGKIIPKDFL